MCTYWRNSSWSAYVVWLTGMWYHAPSDGRGHFYCVTYAGVTGGLCSNAGCGCGCCCDACFSRTSGTWCITWRVWRGSDSCSHFRTHCNIIFDSYAIWSTSCCCHGCWSHKRKNINYIKDLKIRCASTTDISTGMRGRNTTNRGAYIWGVIIACIFFVCM